METKEILMNLILFGLLPLWGISGLLDWACHRATRIEHTSGLKDSLIHSLMGIQLGIPIILALFYYVNVSVLLICFLAVVMHEVVAHWDVHYSAPKREITIWEVHVHNYMATIPLFLFMLLVVINWDMFVNLITFNWAGNMAFRPIESPHGGDNYLIGYLIFMGITCVVPYIEENIRCLKVYLAQRNGAAA